MSSTVVERPRARIPRLVRDARSLGALALASIVLIAAVLAVLVATSAGGEGPPATGAAAVVPGDALAYVHVSIDPGRAAVSRTLTLAKRFPDFPLLRAGLLLRLSSITSSSGTIPGAVDFSTDVMPWLGKEAALALLNTSTSTAGSLIVLDVSNRSRAQRFLARFAPSSQLSYRSIPILAFSATTEAAFVSHYLVLGPDTSVRAAIDAATGISRSLQASSAYQRASAGAPDGRAIDAYASVDGVRRLLAPQGGLTGALGALLYQPALDGVAVAITPSGGGADVRIHSALDPRLARLDQGTTGTGGAFSPSLPSVFPSNATLLLDITKLDQVAPRLLGAGTAGGVAGGVGPLLLRLGAALKAEGVNVQRDILSIFHGETAVALVPTSSASGGRTSGSATPGRPAIVIVAKVPDQERTRAALAALEVPLAQLFPPPGNGPGVAPTFNDRQVAGITAHQLVLTAGLELDYAIFDGKLVFSTSLQGIAGVRQHAQSLLDQTGYRRSFENSPKLVTSLLFLDFSQLLSLSEQTGLTRSARYKSLRADLEKIRTIGLSSTRGEADSTAELFLQIP